MLWYIRTSIQMLQVFPVFKVSSFNYLKFWALLIHKIILCVIPYPLYLRSDICD